MVERNRISFTKFLIITTLKNLHAIMRMYNACVDIVEPIIMLNDIQSVIPDCIYFDCSSQVLLNMMLTRGFQFNRLGKYRTVTLPRLSISIRNIEGGGLLSTSISFGFFYNIVYVIVLVYPDQHCTTISSNLGTLIYTYHFYYDH